MNSRALVPAGILILWSALGAFAADRDAGSIDLSANPSTVAADGKSLCTIAAQVRDRDGVLAPDGTEIQFAASLGVVESTGVVQAGTARVKLISASVPGTSVVTATWLAGQAVARVNVQFGDVSGPQGPEYVDVRADDYLAYSVDHKTLEALGNVKLRYRSLEIEASSVQVDLEKSRIVARSASLSEPIKLISKGGVTEASMFACDLSLAQGFVLSVERGGVRKVTISTAACEIGTEEVTYSPTEFDFRDLSDSAILMKASQATIFPSDKIQFRQANLYVDGKRVLSLPLYVMSLSGNPVEGAQYVGYSTSGVTLNLPFYYNLSPRSSGAFLVRHGQSTGWGQYGQKPGWFVDLRQRYATSGSQGILELNQITRRDWGARFSHNQNLGKGTNAYVSLEYPSHQALYGSMNFNKSLKDFSFGLNLFGSNYPSTGQNSLSGDVHVQTMPKDLGKIPLKYTLAARVERSYDIAAADTAGSRELTIRTGERLDANFFSSPFRLKPNLTVRCFGGLGYVFGDSSTSGLTTLGSAAMDWRISKTSSFQLSYRYLSRPVVYLSHTVGPSGSQQTQIRSQTANQSVTASLTLGDGNKWSASVFAMRGLDYPITTLFADFGYRFSPDWRFSVRSTFSQYGANSYDDLELALGKTISNRELLVVWSKSENKVMLELGSGGF